MTLFWVLELKTKKGFIRTGWNFAKGENKSHYEWFKHVARKYPLVIIYA